MVPPHGYDAVSSSGDLVPAAAPGATGDGLRAVAAAEQLHSLIRDNCTRGCGKLGSQGWPRGDGRIANMNARPQRSLNLNRA